MAQTIISKYAPATAAVRIAEFLFIVFLIGSSTSFATHINIVVALATVFIIGTYLLKYFNIQTSVEAHPEFVKVTYLFREPWSVYYEEIDSIHAHRYSSARSGGFQYQEIILKDGEVLSFSEQDFTNYTILKITIFQNMLEALEKDRNNAD